MNKFVIDSDKNTKLVTLKNSITPKYLTSSTPHNTTIKTDENCYFSFLSKDFKKDGQCFLIYKKRPKGYFVFDFLSGDKETLEQITINSLGGMITRKDYESFINNVITDYDELGLVDFNKKYMK